MHANRLRNHSYMQELSPVCIKIQNVSIDLYPTITRTEKVQKLENLLNNSSENTIKSPKSESITIRRMQYSSTKSPDRLPNIKIPKMQEAAKSVFNAASNRVRLPKDIEKVFKHPISPISSPTFRAKARCTSKTKVTYKDAVRSGEWAAAARPELESMWRTLISVTNGVKPSTSKNQYKCYIGKGNNSELIKRLLASRSWWVQTESIAEANFVWTQWKDRNICEGLKKGAEIRHSFDEIGKVNLNYSVPIRIKENYRQVDLTDLGFYRVKNSLSFCMVQTTQTDPIQSKMYNKIEFNQYLSNKKGLFKSLKGYYDALGMKLFSFHPITFHIKSQSDPELENFLETFQIFQKKKTKKKGKNLWIVKPGENSNRGRGIRVCKSLSEIKETIKENEDASKTSIVQKYIEQPFLVHGRKFDIRCYALITVVNGIIQGYFYSDGYIRTSCAEYSLKDTENNYIHLTNDAIQKHSEDYGKFEDNNKMSYKEFQRYLDLHHADKKHNFIGNTLYQIKSLVKDTIQSVFLNLDCHKRINCMEIFGYDFMLDYKLKPWIIEVNTNPCLELSSSYLTYLIPAMVDNAFRIALDCNFPPNVSQKPNFDPIPENRFELIFHELVDGEKLKQVLNYKFEVSDSES